MSNDTKLNFSEALGEIEEINNWFQNEDIDLDEGLEKFRHGLELIKKCKTRLKQVENEFIEIKKEFNVDEKTTNNSVSKPQSSQNNKEITPKEIPF